MVAFQLLAFVMAYSMNICTRTEMVLDWRDDV